MNHIIEKIDRKLKKFGQLREWFWFAILWGAGLASMLLIALPIKILVIALK